MPDTMSSAQTVHVVDDDEAIRDSLRILLEAAGFAVRAHQSATAFLAEAPCLGGCVLTDVRMPEIDGLELQRRLNESGIRLPVIVMTGQADIPIAVRAMKAGAIDFLEKPFGDEALLDAVRRALAESRRLLEIASVAAGAAGRLATLTPREREVFDLLVTGLSTKAIANELGASPRTIEVHRARVFEKLEARSLPDLVRLMLAAEPRDTPRR
jgi:two-component system response regulator FixJ